MSAVIPIKSKEQILEEWEAAAKALANAKEREMELRLQVEQTWFQGHKDEGTENIALQNGFKLKAVFKLNRSMAPKEQVEQILDQIEALDAEGAFLADRIVRWKPELDKKEYDNLDPKYKVLIDKVITTKPGAPAIEIIEPKAKKG